jgi:hypothetical protein
MCYKVESDRFSVENSERQAETKEVQPTYYRLWRSYHFAERRQLGANMMYTICKGMHSLVVWEEKRRGKPIGASEEGHKKDICPHLKHTTDRKRSRLVAETHQERQRSHFWTSRPTFDLCRSKRCDKDGNDFVS